MKKILLAGALAAALLFAPVAVMAQGSTPAPGTAEAPLLSAGPLPPPAPGAPPSLGMVPPPPPGGFTTPAEMPPQTSAPAKPEAAGKPVAEAPVMPAPPAAPMAPVAPAMAAPPAVPAPAVAPAAPMAPPPMPPAPQMYQPPMMSNNAPSLGAPSLESPLPPGPPILSGPTAPAKGYPSAVAGPAKMDQRTAAVLREAIRGVAALRELPEQPVNDSLLRKILNTGHEACRLANISRFPIMPRFMVRTDDTVIRNRSHETFEYRKFGAFQTRLDGWVKPVSRFVHCNLHFVARGRSSVLIKGVVTRGADLDTDLEIQAGDAYGRLWKLMITSKGLLLRDDGLPAGGSLSIVATDPGNRSQTIAYQFPIEEAWKKPEVKAALRKQDGSPVAIPPEPWQLRDAPKASVRSTPTIAPVPAAPCPMPDGSVAPSQETGTPKHFHRHDVVPAGYDDPNSPNILPSTVSGQPAPYAVPAPAAPTMGTAPLPAPVLAPPTVETQCPQPPQEEKNYRHRKKPKHW